MLEIVIAGGWLMLPIILGSAVAFAIVAERFWSLRQERIVPKGLFGQIQQWSNKGRLDPQHLEALQSNSPMGRILAAGLKQVGKPRGDIRAAMEEVAGQEIHEMERFLSTLGTIAAISPLLGLLGTVMGMIEVFTALMLHGSGDTSLLAGGISKALITTAAGLCVAIPAMFFHRMLLRRVDEIAVSMETQAAELLNWLTDMDNQGV